MITIQMSPAAEQHLDKVLMEKFGAKVQKLATGLHDQVLQHTPMHTGSTLASWTALRDGGMPNDVEGGKYVEGSNKMPVGTEPGRDGYEAISVSSRKNWGNFLKNPFGRFLISNGASLRSLFSSDLKQGVGSRALYQDLGIIAHFSPWHSTYDANGKLVEAVYPWLPRGKGMVRKAYDTFLASAKNLIK